MLENIKDKQPQKIERCRYFLADRGYDSTDLIEWLTTEGAAPIIDIRNMWQGEENRQFGDTDLAYNYKGKVNYVPEKGEAIYYPAGISQGKDPCRGEKRFSKTLCLRR